MKFQEYRGMSREQASREAANIIAIASKTGRWEYDLPQRLSALRDIMQVMGNARQKGLHIVASQSAIAQAFNEWMRRYTENPEEFEREWQTVGEYLEQQAEGVEPDYGASCAAYLLKLIDATSS